MAELELNPLLSTGRAPDTALQVQLHPLVLLTISDYLTRHTLRQLDSPLIGAILGQQNGRDITMEHAFECKASLEKGCILMDTGWFAKRLEEYREVHKAPALDLVGGFVLGPTTGPVPAHLPVTQQLLHVNEAATLLLFHPSSVSDESSTGGKLPISVYEAFYEPGSENDDKSTQLEKVGMGRQLKLKYRQLDYSMDAGEAEMIGMDFVARGAGNAAAVASTAPIKPTNVADVSKGKGRALTGLAGDDGQKTETVLSAEDEERTLQSQGWEILGFRIFHRILTKFLLVLAQLTAKANAIKMLQRRINLVKAYLTSLPPSYLSDASIPISSILANQHDASLPHPDHSVLRSIQALLTRLSLLVPVNRQAFALESSQQKSDVALVELLGSVTQTLQAARELGKKFAVVESGRNHGRKGTGFMTSSPFEHGRPGTFLD
ncbi:MAG: hypothetical protein M1822_007500 [Bathelium mastoideum]|nr:MAG: hypothetical protein M1822_007500 [Bathelium mastoideum]